MYDEYDLAKLALPFQYGGMETIRLVYSCLWQFDFCTVLIVSIQYYLKHLFEAHMKLLTLHHLPSP